jgi:hypothetical protein
LALTPAGAQPAPGTPPVVGVDDLGLPRNHGVKRGLPWLREGIPEL